jgi:hypothetical protein
MNSPRKTTRDPSRWVRRVFVLLVFLALFIVCSGVLGYYLYRNLTGVVVWLASLSCAPLRLELQHAGFTNSRRIELRKIALAMDGGEGRMLLIDKAVIDFRWGDLRNHRIGSIRLENPRILINDRALAAGPSAPQTKSSPVSPNGLWLVDEFKITGGKAEINLSHSPLIRFGFDSVLRNIYLSPAIKFSTQPQTLNLTGIEFLGKEAKPLRFGTIKSLAVQFSLDHLAVNKIDGIAIQTPSFWLTPALLRTFGADSAGAPAAVPDAAATSAPAAPWVIGKLHLSDGDFFMNGFGGNVPVASMKIAFDDQDLQLGAAGGALAEKLHTAQIWDLRVAADFAPLDPFLWVGSAQVDFTAGGLFGSRQIAGLTITHLDFLMGQKFRSFLAAIDQQGVGGAKVQPAPGAPDSPWSILKLKLINARATLADLGDELPNITFKLDTEMDNVALSNEIRHAGSRINDVKISDLMIHSPHDPFVPVLNFSTIHLRFSLAQILDQEIEAVILDKPTLFVGEQLFWYGDELKKRQTPPSAGPAPAAAPRGAPRTGWHINKFSVEGGQLVVANAGHSGVAMPFEFSSEAENIWFNNLSDLQLKVQLVIKNSDYRFPSYQLAFKQLDGKIDFDLPPGSGAKDVVQTLHAEGAKWKQFEATKLWLSVTYDSKGIYGGFGGAGYDGYVNGGFEFYMLPDTPWAGWVSGKGIDLKKITDILAPQSFQLSGPSDFKVHVNGLNHEIERLTGNLGTIKGGRLKIGKLDQIIDSIPKTWGGIKQGSTRIVLETLRDFDYTSGNGDFWYAGDMGHLTLQVRGPHGSRNFDIALHGD